MAAMITEEAFMDIMALDRQALSMRFIAKKLGLNRNTVKKLIPGKPFPEYRRSERRVSILTPLVHIIQYWLAQNHYRASLVFKRLKPIGYEGSYKTFKKFIRSIKDHQFRIAYVRFETMPGLQAHVDWADFQVSEPNDKSSTVNLFILGLGYCRAIYAEFVNNYTLESFLEGHIRAFHYLGGVPAELLYDNMRHLVIRDFVGKVDFNLVC
jgi:transposase